MSTVNKNGKRKSAPRKIADDQEKSVAVKRKIPIPEFQAA